MIYLCTLEPVDTFFFGGETTFGDDGTNYYAKSNRLPQQTSLLGMLRYLLLMNVKPDRKKRKEVIGPKSFIANRFSGGFGFIKGLSPVFLQANKQKFFPAPLFLNHQQKPVEVSENKGVRVFTNSSSWTEGWSTSDQYQVKEGLSDDHFVTSYQRVCASGSLFTSVTKVGITKDRGGSSDEKGFYKQELYRLKSAKFAFLVDLEGYKNYSFDPLSLDKSIATIGGEQASFIFRIREHSASSNCTDTFLKLATEAYQAVNPQDQLEKLVLTSDAYVAADIYNHCRFAISQTVDFRNIVTPGRAYENQDFASLSQEKTEGEAGKEQVGNTEPKKMQERKATGRYKSAKFNLLRRGSVLYPKEGDTAKLVEKLKKKEKENFYQIGYNHFIKLPNT